MKGLDYQTLPRALKQKEYFEITRIPLLNCLIALRFVSNNQTIETNLSLLYQGLLEEVYKSKWRTLRPENRNFTLSDFFTVLEEIALTIWHKEEKIISLEEIQSLNIEIDDLDIITSFYFRKIDENTFEFTHKTFSEYLTAKAIVRGVREIFINRDSGSLQEVAALNEWRKISGFAPIGHDIYKFILDEIQNYDKEDVENWQSVFFDLLLLVINQFVPMDESGISNYPQMIQHVRNTEEGLLAIYSACFQYTAKRSSFDWKISERDNFSYFWKRINYTENNQKQRLTDQILSGLELNSCNLETLNFTEVKIHSLDLIGAKINNSNFKSATFINTNLRSAELEDCNLQGVTFADGSTLRESKFNRTNFSKTVISKGTDLTNAKFVKANCTKSVLCKTTLINTNFSESFLNGADLREADLTKAILEKANLSEAKLQGAKLTNTNFRYANLQKADFSDATFENTDFTGADLRGAKFTDIDTDNMILTDVIFKNPEPIDWG